MLEIVGWCCNVDREEYLEKSNTAVAAESLTLLAPSFAERQGHPPSQLVGCHPPLPSSLAFLALAQCRTDPHFMGAFPSLCHCQGFGFMGNTEVDRTLEISKATLMTKEALGHSSIAVPEHRVLPTNHPAAMDGRQCFSPLIGKNVQLLQGPTEQKWNAYGKCLGNRS